jgi:hypothetical protein
MFVLEVTLSIEPLREIASFVLSSNPGNSTTGIPPETAKRAGGRGGQALGFSGFFRPNSRPAQRRVSRHAHLFGF